MEPSPDRLWSHEQLAAETCESCGRHPARPITVRRHVGLLVLQQFVTVQATACRACGLRLLRRFTLRTLVQGWWGAISFFFNWFVLGANAVAWLKLRRLEAPMVSGTEGQAPPPSADWPSTSEDETAASRKSSRLSKIFGVVVLGGVLLGLAGWGWDATHHDHGGPHGPPLAVATVEAELTQGSFASEDGTSVQVQAANCDGEGAAEGGGYTHLECQLHFSNGEFDIVVVHVLADEFFFKTTEG
jgi:hypothetical protein